MCFLGKIGGTSSIYCISNLLDKLSLSAIITGIGHITMKDLQARIDVLKSQHKELDRQLIEAEKVYESDDMISRLKKEKLKIKDTIQFLLKEIHSSEA